MKTGSLITNILGLVFVVPSTICSTICAAGVAGAGSNTTDSGTAAAYGGITIMLSWGGLIICIIASIIGFVALGKPKTTLAMAAGVLLISGGVLNFSQVFFGFNILSFLVGILYIVSGILCITNKEGLEEISPQQA